VQEISAGELLEEDGEAPEEASAATHGPAAEHLPLRSVVEVPVVLDRSLFSGDSPIEIRLKLYIK
jgi:hypothetical protein